jgi:hypothetical protein
MRRKPHSTSLVLLLVCIFAFWWGVSVLAQNSSFGGTQTAATGQSNAGPLAITESRSGDTYTYSGNFVPGSACEQIGSGISYSGTAQNQVTILLNTTSASTDCAQAAGTASIPFSASIKLAGGEPSFAGVLLNNQPIAAQLAAN